MNRRLTSFAAAVALLAASLSVAPAPAVAQPQAGVLQQSGTVSVTIPSLNVRAGPSFNDDIVGLLSGGSNVRVLGQSGDGQWLRIDYQGFQAWIRAEFTTSGAGAPAAAPAAAAPAAASGSTVTPNGEFANVRSGPGLDNDVVGQLQSGQSAAVLSREGEWFKVDFQGRQAYVFNGVVDEKAGTAPVAAAAAPAGTEGATPTVDRLNVRAGGSLDADIVGALPRGQVVRILAVEGEWLRVDYQGRQAYIFAALSSRVGSPGSSAAAAPGASVASATSGSLVITTRNVEVRSAPNAGNVIATVNANSAMFFVANEGAFTKVTVGGATGFVPSDSVYLYGGAAPAAAAPSAPAAPSSPAPVPSTAGGGTFELGTHIKDPERLDMIKGSGMDWVKVQIVAPGGAPNIKGLIDQLHGAGLKVLIGLVGDRGRAPDLGYHSQFAGVAAEIARQGADAIEVWNEPNLDREWGGGGANKVNPDAFANLLKESYNAIKAANPGVMVVAGAPAPTGYAGGNCRGDVCDDKPFVERLRAAGGANYMDCMGAHYNGSPNPPNLRSGGPTGDHHSWYFWGTFDTTYNAIGGKPICFTEMGYVTKDGIAGSLPGGFSWGNSITLGNQSQWLGELVTNLRGSGRARLGIIWNWNFRQFDEDPQAGYSIFRPDGTCPSCGSVKAAMGR